MTFIPHRGAQSGRRPGHADTEISAAGARHLIGSPRAVQLRLTARWRGQGTRRQAVSRTLAAAGHSHVPGGDDTSELLSRVATRLADGTL